MTGWGARDLLSQLDDEAVGIEEVESAVSPRAADGPSQDLNA